LGTITQTDRIAAGIVLREQDIAAWRGRLNELSDAVLAAGLDHVTVGDHVSFAHGHGVDGLIQATALLSAHDGLAVQTGVYLLGLRHPAAVARQLATISLLAPGRFTFGVGVGGDDRAELELCGVDPRTRGVRFEESLALVRQFMTGEPVDLSGPFFTVRGAAIRPAPTPPIPILVGGRSDAALRRTARLGEGWLALWISPRRFAAAADWITGAAGRAGRRVDGWSHTLQLWAGFDVTHEHAAERVGRVMERAYDLPFERFAKYTPCGRPEDVAESLMPYLEAGCRRFNFVPEATDMTAAIESIAEVKRLLAGS
jgi:alkanesulfonate monooxygenase SsuD/methylene tetrahydromethanopterin reductase-like flavin-dependent oxidoreductase (luciferase family)